MVSITDIPTRLCVPTADQPIGLQQLEPFRQHKVELVLKALCRYYSWLFSMGDGSM